MNSVNRLSGCALIVVAALVAGCASKPSIRSNADPAADFSKYQSFGFLDEVMGRTPDYESFTIRYIKTAVAREMGSRGFQKNAQPQLLVNIHIQTKDKVKVTEASSGYYGYRYGAYGWGAGVHTSVDNYTEGTLNVDVVDSAASKLLWEGIAIGRIRDKPSDDPQAAVDAVVKQVFERFPKQP